MPRARKTPADGEAKTASEKQPATEATEKDPAPPADEQEAAPAKGRGRGRGRPATKKAKKEDEEPRSFVDVLKQRYPGKIYRGAEYTAPWLIRRFPTGIVKLDIALQGGFPAGCLNMLIGQPHVGKNMLANCAISRAQDTFGDDLRVGVLTTENVYDKSQARFGGIQIAYSADEIAAIRRARERAGSSLSAAEEKELRTEIGEFTIVPPLPGQELFDIGLDMVRSRYFHIVLIDSFGAILLDEDKDKDLTQDDRMGGPSGLNTRFATRLMQALAPNEKSEPNLTCVLGINQIRDNMKAGPGQPTTREGGGWGLKHARSTAIEMVRTAWQNAEKGSKVRTGKEVQWAVTKQKAGGYDGHVGRFLYRMELGPHFAQDIIETGTDLGVIDKTGSTYSYEDEVIGPKKQCGLLKAADWLEEERELMEHLYQECLKAADVYCNYR